MFLVPMYAYKIVFLEEDNASLCAIWSSSPYIHTWYKTKIGVDYLVPLHTYTS